MTVPIVNQLLAILTIAAQVGLAVGLIYFWLFRRRLHDPVLNFVGRFGLLAAFIISLTSFVSSLFYSEVAGFPPCNLCWLQRLFMYPQVIILGLTWLTPQYRQKLISIALTLAGIGLLIALYHNYIYYGGATPFPCEAFGLGTSCTKRYVFEFGYITIPIMSLTGFLLLLFFLGFHHRWLKFAALPTVPTS